MKNLLLLAALCVSGAAQADANSDAFNAGAGFGKGSSSQGTSSLSNPGAVTGSIPGYTSNPAESGFYNGVTGGDGGLSDKGQAALQGSTAGQAVIDAGTKNPAPVIDPNAPFITAGKAAESTAGSVLDGTSTQCTTTTVSKSTFENFTCSADVAVQKTCTRDTQITGHYETRNTTSTVNVEPTSWSFGKPSSTDTAMSFAFPLPAGATMLSGSITIVLGNNDATYLSYMNLFGQNIRLSNSASQSYGLAVASQTVPGDGVIRGTFTNSTKGFLLQFWNTIASYQTKFYVTVQIVSTQQVWVPSTSTPSECPSGPGGKLTGSVCTIGAGDRTTVVDGVTQTVHSDCWQYTDTYLVSEDTTGTCASLVSNPACTKSAETCSEYVGSDCSHKDYTYQCQKVFSSSGLVCGGQYFCQTGDCSDTDGAGDSGFDTAVAKLAGLASAGDDVVNDQINIKAFTGEAMSCRKAFAGFSNCCKDSGWGADAGLANCNSNEMALGKAKAKKVTVSVGERCDHQVLGACIQKSQVYCVFGGKLARIIQEQGRRDQLGIGFGSGDNPDCSGITVPQLQGINFDLINFSDFYEDLINNQKIPDSAVMVKQVKDRIAAQVQQQQSGAAK